MVKIMMYESLNLSGPRRLVSGAGDIKLTKDGNVLLHEMVCRAGVG